MTDRVAKMAQERESISVYFMKFMAFAKDLTRTVCFFEGEDQKYFVSRLDGSTLKLKWTGIDCNGKKNVLKVHSVITAHETYKSSLAAFFIDRDFDDPITMEMRNFVYETPCYSIENFYCTEHCLSRVLDIEFKLGNDPIRPELLKQALENFQKLRESFQAAIRPLNVWIKAHRTKELKEGRKALNLQNVSLDKFVAVSKDTVISICAPIDIQSFFPGSYNLSAEELQSAERSLPMEDSHSHFRGKYQLEFVRKFLDNLRTECKDKSSHFYNPGNAVKLSLSKGNFISELSQYALTPDCLSDFLDKLTVRSAKIAS
ncbi:MAG: hypothetical protein JWR21_1109 [Herminiimonas sp.]|nr:hypothetical protein [Herminiimonas sp.]